jgi:hypothetical protein
VKYLSELNDFAARLERVKGYPVSLEEYQQRKAAGDTFDPPEPLDRDRLAHIVAFATDALRDADAVRAEAAGLQQAAFALYHDASLPDEMTNHYRRVRAWHLAEAERKVS